MEDDCDDLLTSIDLDSMVASYKAAKQASQAFAPTPGRGNTPLNFSMKNPQPSSSSNNTAFPSSSSSSLSSNHHQKQHSTLPMTSPAPTAPSSGLKPTPGSSFHKVPHGSRTPLQPIITSSINTPQFSSSSGLQTKTRPSSTSSTSASSSSLSNQPRSSIQQVQVKNTNLPGTSSFSTFPAKNLISPPGGSKPPLVPSSISESASNSDDECISQHVNRPKAPPAIAKPSPTARLPQAAPAPIAVTTASVPSAFAPPMPPAGRSLSLQNGGLTPQPPIDRKAASTWVFPTNLPRRDYQFNIISTALFNNALVCLPTGLGKTFIAAVVMYNYYRWFPTGKIVFAAPSKPLVTQQIRACAGMMGIPAEDMGEVTGQLSGTTARRSAWASKRVFFVTPQTINYDLKKGFLVPSDIVCVVFDEAHRATGSYAYVELVNELYKVNVPVRILALSATPGETMERVREVVRNLKINKLIVKNENDFDIARYVHTRRVELITVSLPPEIRRIQEAFDELLKPSLRRLFHHGVYHTTEPGQAKKGSIRAAQAQLQREGANGNSNKGYLFRDFALASQLTHARELLILYGVRAFQKYVGDLENEVQGRTGGRAPAYADCMKSYAYRGFKASMSCVARSVHPKLERLESVLLKHFDDKARAPLPVVAQPDPSIAAVDGVLPLEAPPKPETETRVMIFAQYRSTVEEIVLMLNQHEPKIKAMEFCGQKGTKGMSQKEQLRIVREFRAGGYNTLVSTCIGEEGLDIGEVDLIICFDALSSSQRMVQRMGRTGRRREGRVVVLMTEGFEEGAYKAGERKKKAMTREAIATSVQLNPYVNRMVPMDIKPSPVSMFVKPCESALALARSLDAAADKKLDPEHELRAGGPMDWVLDESCRAHIVKRYLFEDWVAGKSRVLSVDAWPHRQSKPDPVSQVSHSALTEILNAAARDCQTSAVVLDDDEEDEPLELVLMRMRSKPELRAYGIGNDAKAQKGRARTRGATSKAAAPSAKKGKRPHAEMLIRSNLVDDDPDFETDEPAVKKERLTGPERPERPELLPPVPFAEARATPAPPPPSFSLPVAPDARGASAETMQPPRPSSRSTDGSSLIDDELCFSQEPSVAKPDGLLGAGLEVKSLHQDRPGDENLKTNKSHREFVEEFESIPEPPPLLSKRNQLPSPPPLTVGESIPEPPPLAEFAPPLALSHAEASAADAAAEGGAGIREEKRETRSSSIPPPPPLDGDDNDDEVDEIAGSPLQPPPRAPLHVAAPSAMAAALSAGIQHQHRGGVVDEEDDEFFVRGTEDQSVAASSIAPCSAAPPLASRSDSSSMLVKDSQGTIAPTTPLKQAAGTGFVNANELLPPLELLRGDEDDDPFSSPVLPPKPIARSLAAELDEVTMEPPATTSTNVTAGARKIVRGRPASHAPPPAPSLAAASESGLEASSMDLSEGLAKPTLKRIVRGRPPGHTHDRVPAPECASLSEAAIFAMDETLDVTGGGSGRGDESTASSNMSFCARCETGGDLICCDGCRNAFHEVCLPEGREDLPEGDWFCSSQCSPEDEEPVSAAPARSLIPPPRPAPRSLIPPPKPAPVVGRKRGPDGSAKGTERMAKRKRRARGVSQFVDMEAELSGDDDEEGDEEEDDEDSGMSGFIDDEVVYEDDDDEEEDEIEEEDDDDDDDETAGPGAGVRGLAESSQESPQVRPSRVRRGRRERTSKHKKKRNKHKSSRPMSSQALYRRSLLSPSSSGIAGAFHRPANMRGGSFKLPRKAGHLLAGSPLAHAIGSGSEGEGSQSSIVSDESSPAIGCAAPSRRLGATGGAMRGFPPPAAAPALSAAEKPSLGHCSNPISVDVEEDGEFLKPVTPARKVRGGASAAGRPSGVGGETSGAQSIMTPVKKSPRGTTDHHVIVVDPSMLNTQLSDYLRHDHGVRLVMHPLGGGVAYALSGKVCVKRLTGVDLVKSVRDGSFDDSLTTMSMKYSSPVLVLEQCLLSTNPDGVARFRFARGESISRAVSSALTSTMVRHPSVRVIQTDSTLGSAQMIAQIAMDCARESGGRTLSAGKVDPWASPRKSQQDVDLATHQLAAIEFLCSIPCVNYVVAAQLVANSRSMAEIVSLSAQELVARSDLTLVAASDLVAWFRAQVQAGASSQVE